MVLLDAQWQATCRAVHDICPSTWPVPESRLTALALWLRKAGSDTDSVAQFLIERAQDGESLAGECLIQAVLPKLVREFQRHPRHQFGDYLTHAWLRIMAYPRTRRHAVLTNLALDTLKAVTREYSRSNREQAFDQLPEPDDVAAESPRHVVSEIIDLAADRSLVPKESAAVLRTVYHDGLSGKSAAVRHRTTPEMIRYRCSASVKVLRAHRQLLMALL
jgi:DNA-directed RNA polymerase specialized sigma24 family protein